MTARGGGVRALAVFACAALLAGCGSTAAEDRSDYAYQYDPAVVDAMSAAPEIPKDTPTPAPERMVVDDRKWFTLTVPLRWVMLDSDAAHVTYAPAEGATAYVRADVVRFPGAWRLQPVELARSIACSLSGAKIAKDAVMGIWQNVPMLAVSGVSEPDTESRLEHDPVRGADEGVDSNSAAGPMGNADAVESPESEITDTEMSGPDANTATPAVISDDGRSEAEKVDASKGTGGAAAERKPPYRVYCVSPDTVVILTYDDGGDPAMTKAVEAVRDTFAIKASGAAAGESNIQEYTATDLLTGLTDVIACGMRAEPGKPLGKAFPQMPVIFDGTEKSVAPGEVAMLHMGHENASFFAYVRNEGKAQAAAERCTLCGVELFANFAADGDRMDDFRVGTGFAELTGKLGAPRYATNMHGEWCLDGQTLIAYFEDDVIASMMVIWQTEAERDERRKEYIQLQQAAESAAAAADILNQIPAGGQAVPTDAGQPEKASEDTAG